MSSAIQISTEPWSRRCSVESVRSIQEQETDFVRDSSDTEGYTDDGQELEFEPCTEPEDDAPALGDSSGESDNEIIATKVIEVSVRDDGDLVFADSEQTDTEGFDSEVDLCDYWNCAQCGAINNNPIYRYCERCFKVRKNFFPPRPKRKNKRKSKKDPEETRPLSQTSCTDDEKDRLTLPQENDTQNEPPLLSQQSNNFETENITLPYRGVYVQESSALLKYPAPRVDFSQKMVHVLSKSDKDQEQTPSCLSQDSGFDSQELSDPTTSGLTEEIKTVITEVRLSNTIKDRPMKRRSGSADRNPKRIRLDISSDSDSDSDTEVVTPLVKTISDPSLTVEDVKVTKEMLKETAKEIDKDNNMCIVCLSEPKSGVFVHGRIAHICCCYKCAVKVWAKAKRCPVCNCKVSNVLKAVVM